MFLSNYPIRLDNLSGKLLERRVFYAVPLSNGRHSEFGNTIDVIIPMQDQWYEENISFVLHIRTGYWYGNYQGNLVIPITMGITVNKESGIVNWHAKSPVVPLYDTRVTKQFVFVGLIYSEAHRGFGVRIVHKGNSTKYDILLEAHSSSNEEDIRRVQFYTHTIDISSGSFPDLTLI